MANLKSINEDHKIDRSIKTQIKEQYKVLLDIRRRVYRILGKKIPEKERGTELFIVTGLLNALIEQQRKLLEELEEVSGE